jgi:hypothetical protein
MLHPFRGGQIHDVQEEVGLDRLLERGLERLDEAVGQAAATAQREAATLRDELARRPPIDIIKELDVENQMEHLVRQETLQALLLVREIMVVQIMYQEQLLTQEAVVVELEELEEMLELEELVMVVLELHLQSQVHLLQEQVEAEEEQKLSLQVQEDQVAVEMDHS